jgi:hypothetical protein
VRNRFQLRSLRVTGQGKPVAEVTFRPGANVISGASNTGKSYILQCIAFMLGSSKKPKKIGESKGYTTCILELEDEHGVTHQLERSLSGDFFIHRIIVDGVRSSEEFLLEKHDPDNVKTISGFLLGLMNAWGLKVRMSKAGKTRSISFSDFRRLTIVDEVRIISEGSPALSGQHSSVPVEKSFFKLVLTGLDDSSVVALETRTQSVARRTAQLDLIDGLIARLERDIRDLDPEPLTLNFRLGAVNSALQRVSETMTGKQQALIEEEGRRRDALRSAMKLEQRQNATGELRERFRLLEEHYNSDLARLLAISELDSFFIQLQESRCPLCGAEGDQHDPSIHHDQATPALTDIQRACVAESNKIRALLKDLVGTTNELDVELSSIEVNLQEQRALFASSSKALEETLAPAAEQSASEWNETILLKDRLTQAQVLNERFEALQAERNRIAATKWKQSAKAEEARLLDLEATKDFSLTVESLLKSWSYPDLERVTFEEAAFDLIISGKDRGSEGKGFRAIAYAAYIIGLLEYAMSSDPGQLHPGFVVLDSPLVTYKRRDTGPDDQVIPEDVATAFYQSLASLPDDKQVIVLENNDPPEELHEKLHYHHFSRSSLGRYGFFPVRK